MSRFSSRLLLTLALASPVAACGALLGIDDVPTPAEAAAGESGTGAVGGGAAGTGGSSDASFDTLVVPDGPFEGCNSGAEDCANGLDDNCNGLIDCMDPVCVGAGYVCTVAPPKGWSGPVAFAIATGGTIPACSGAYGAAAETGHAGLTAPQASCSCSCPNQASNTQCGDVTVFGYPGTNCDPTPNNSTPIPTNGGCLSIPTTSALSASAGVPTDAGSCAPNVNDTITPAVWANSYAACNYIPGKNVGGCSSGEMCVLAPTSAYLPKTCVYQSGDLACPGAPYTAKTLFTTQLDDTRGCTKCDCKATGGTCAANVTGWENSNCSGAQLPFGTDGGCGQPAQPFNAAQAFGSVVPASCVKSGGTATGAATASNPITVCCQP